MSEDLIFCNGTDKKIKIKCRSIKTHIPKPEFIKVYKKRLSKKFKCNPEGEGGEGSVIMSKEPSLKMA